MTAADFRKLALSFPDTVEASHMGHPDFRAHGKIFATFPKPDEKVGMIKLTPEQQAMFVKDEPDMFEPVPGGWGRGGATLVKLKAAKITIVRRAMQQAVANVTAKKK
ncbi:MAG: MmcQ/YjbR family DNA-binding protein [Acidobacteriia bacterium]|nr:MmcQ/YjbR family DNA-binding protein [Terriglobia bacterium]